MKQLLAVILLAFGIAGAALAQPAVPMPSPKIQFFDNSGVPLNGGRVCSFAAGTTNAQTTYTDSTRVTANADPVVLDTSGRASIFLTSASYKFSIYKSDGDSNCPNSGTLLYTQDNVPGQSRFTGTAAPISGTYSTGDFVWNVTPSTGTGSSSAYLGWLCTLGGTPGSWVGVAGLLNNHMQNATTADGNFTVTGNETVGGTLGVTGASTLTGNTSVGGTLGVTGASTFTSFTATGNGSVGGTFGVTGATTLTGATTTPAQFTTTLADGTPPFVVTSTTPVANLTSQVLAYNPGGTQQKNAHAVFGTCTLGSTCAVTLSGSAAFTGTSTYYCSATDQTAANAVKIVNTSSNLVTLTGTGTDVLGFVCIGN